MTLSLRERRRRKTAHDIQRACLALALEQGIDNITTGAIAAAAGVSPRTFFNYYANKEAAAVGIPPGFRESDLTALRMGSAPLAEDLKRFLEAHIACLAEAPETLRQVRMMVRRNDRVRAVLHQFLVEDRDHLTDCLNARLQDHSLATALASNAVCSMAQAIQLWETGTETSLPRAFDQVWEAQITAARMLGATASDSG